MTDPRHYQIAVLCTFTVFGRFWLGFDFALQTALVTIVSALLMQHWLFGAQYKSALISALSLVLLLRTDTLILAVLAAIVAIGSKRFVRIQKRHVFNPSALALVLVTFMFPQAWLAPGQWGPMGLSVLLLAAAGLLVVTRARRMDVALAFLFSFAALVLLRGWWLGDPLPIALHQLQNGALIVFAFFMITDPKTTAVTARLRIAQGICVAAVAAVIQFYFYQHSAALYSLVLLAPLFAMPYFHKETANEKNTSDTDARSVHDGIGQRTGLLWVLRRQG
ncbi:MAG: RnfABCDGE type electron transport complex subunit D [Pseudomonadota bacterium]